VDRRTARPGPAAPFPARPRGLRRSRRDRHDAAPDPVVPPAPSTIDLHTHTRRSDGVLEPSVLVEAAAEVGVRLLAITDHDTLAGYREAVNRIVPAGLELLPGVEINAIVADRPDLWESEVHIVGLGVDPADEPFEAALAGQRDARRRRFDLMLQRLRDLGLGVDSALEGSPGDDDSLGRPTVARALIEMGHATSVEDAFQRYLSRGASAYVPRNGLGPADAIRTIRDAGGLPVLAHFSEAPDRIGVIRELIAVGLGGLEVYYRTFDRRTVDAVGAVARALALVPTGGTDYHGDTETYAQAHAALWVPPEVAPRLREAIEVASSATHP
jgi:3',5'-nucleoside bisphosphate phosphatase